MIKLLISSNYKKHFDTYIDFIDHYWIKFFEKKNINYILIPNSKKIATKKIYKNNNVNLIILAGGNDVFAKDSFSKLRLEIELKLIRFGIKENIPILGICRGMQVLNIYFKGKLNKIEGHMRKNHIIKGVNNFFKKKKFMVNSFHNYGISKKSISKNFIIYANDEKGNVEMFKHKTKNLYGVMWHPERNKNFSQLNKIVKKILNK